MIDLALVRAALRSRAEGLVVASTGAATLSATATGYARTSGSFIDDGFVVGQDITPTGFTQTTVCAISKVEASMLTIYGGRTVQASGSGRTLVSGLPTMRALVNEDLTPSVVMPYVVESMPLGGSGVQTIPGRTGRFQQDGLSVWTWYAIAKTGAGALDKGATALMKRFAPYTRLSLSDGTYIDMRGDVGPSAGDIISEAGWARVTVTLPWRASSWNVVAA